MSESALAILTPFYTDRIRGLVHDRLFCGLKFFEAGALRTGYQRGEVKLVLLLVRLANPRECLNESETALIDAPMRQVKNKPHSGQFTPKTNQVKPQGKK